MAADGSIRINTGLNLDGVKKDISELKKKLKELDREAQANEKATEKTVKEREKAIEKAATKNDDESAQKVEEAYAQQYAELSAKKEEINDSQIKYNALLEKATLELERQKQIQNAGSQLDYEVKKYDATAEIGSRKELNSLLDETKSRMAIIEEAAARVAEKTGTEKAEILKTNKEYQKLSNTLNILKDIKKQLNDNSAFSKMTSGIVEKMQSTVSGIKEKAGSVFKKIPGADTFLKNMSAGFKGMVSLSKRFAGAVKAGIGAAFRGVGKIASGVFGTIGSLAKKTGSKITNSFSSGAKFVLKFGASLFAAKGAYSLLRNAVSSCLNNNKALKNQISGLSSAFGELLGPAINFVINLLSKAVSYISAFTNALFKVNLVAKANAKALKNQGAAAKEAKRSTAGFDEINKLNDSSSSASSGSAGTSGFKEVELPNWGQTVVDSIKSGDWASAALVLTEKLNGVVKNVDWAGIGKKLGLSLGAILSFLATAILGFDWYNLGASLAECLNNIIANVDWGNLGIVLGAKFIILFKTLAGFFATFDWKTLGKSLADGFMGLWNSIDWAETGKMLSDGIKGIIDSVVAFIENIDWQKLGNDVADFIAAIDWSGLCSSLFEGIGAALGGLAAFLWGLIEDAWNSVMDWLYETTHEDGEFTISGLFDGILEALSNINQWIKEHIFEPFINGFKKAFGIASPSKEMKKQGGFIMDGLFGGITEKIDKIKSAASKVKEAIIGVFKNLGSKFKEIFENAWTKVKDVFSKKGKIFDGIKEGISETFRNIVNKLIDGINVIVSKPFNAINSMLNKVRSINVLGLQPFVNLWDYNPLSVPKIPHLKLARGGIVNVPGRGVITPITGEDGREAVLPLDKNTGWIDELAEKLAGLLGAGGQIVIPIYLDGKIIAKYIVDLKERRAFMSNGRITV